MGMILVLLLVCGIVAALTYWGCRKDKWKGAAIGATVASIICSIIIVLTLSISYESYVIIRTQYDATIKQYKGAVTMYTNHATIDIKKASFTDFKYQGYQKNVANFIRELRKEIIKYNKELISKRIMDKTFMFNWLIFVPDKDMKVINMLEQDS